MAYDLHMTTFEDSNFLITGDKTFFPSISKMQSLLTSWEFRLQWSFGKSIRSTSGLHWIHSTPSKHSQNKNELHQSCVTVVNPNELFSLLLWHFPCRIHTGGWGVGGGGVWIFVLQIGDFSTLNTVSHFVIVNPSVFSVWLHCWFLLFT